MKKKIGLVTGGYSGESVISYKSAESMRKHLDASRWDVYLIDINPLGWNYLPDGGQPVPVDKNDFSFLAAGEKVKLDAVLLGLHGTPGEDGKLQGYFDCLNIPYTSCDAATSALTFNKRFTVAVAAFAGIPVARSIHLFRDRPLASAEILSSLALPVFVKPNNGGSSIGMSKVNVADELDAALEKAFREDDQVLVEEFIKGREFTIGVFRHGGRIIDLPITEVVSQNEFFDFEAKYKGASREITPAEIDEATANKIRHEARRAYEVFNARGVVRMDFILHATENKPYLLEINTVPGQSEASIVPQQVRAMGWSLQEFYSALIEDCLENAVKK